MALTPTIDIKYLDGYQCRWGIIERGERMEDQWDHRMASVNGINIHYVLEGQGNPVVLIHGWPEFWFGWRKQIPVLSRRFQTIVPDMRGFGYSDKPLQIFTSWSNNWASNRWTSWHMTSESGWLTGSPLTMKKR